MGLQLSLEENEQKKPKDSAKASHAVSLFCQYFRGAGSLTAPLFTTFYRFQNTLTENLHTQRFV